MAERFRLDQLVPMKEAAMTLSRQIERVSQGETLILTKRSKPVARLTPFASAGLQRRADQLATEVHQLLDESEHSEVVCLLPADARTRLAGALAAYYQREEPE